MCPVGAEFRGAKTVERVRLGQKAVLECAPQGDQPIRHNSDLRDIRVYTKCFQIYRMSGIMADNATSFCFSLCFYQIKPPTIMPCKNQSTQPTLISV